MKRFNVRVYGILFNDAGEVLISEEFRNKIKMSKFPGGGLEFGEGLTDCLKREIMEEMRVKAFNLNHFYTTDFFIQSAFNSKEQLLSIYYNFDIEDKDQIPVVKKPYEKLELIEEAQCFRWVDVNANNPMTFPIDKLVFDKLKNTKQTS